MIWSTRPAYLLERLETWATLRVSPETTSIPSGTLIRATLVTGRS
jgi:hypothetical protein